MLVSICYSTERWLKTKIGSDGVKVAPTVGASTGAETGNVYGAKDNADIGALLEGKFITDGTCTDALASVCIGILLTGT